MKGFLCLFALLSLGCVLFTEAQNREEKDSLSLRKLLYDLGDYLRWEEVARSFEDDLVGRRLSRCCPAMYCHSVCHDKNCCEK